MQMFWAKILLMICLTYMVNEVLDLADRYDLYVTAGSDYHGANKMIVLGDIGMQSPETRPERLEAFLERVLNESRCKDGHGNDDVILHLKFN